MTLLPATENCTLLAVENCTLLAPDEAVARAPWAAVRMDQVRCVFIPSRRRRECCCDTISTRGRRRRRSPRRVGVSRRTVYHWIETGQLDRELDAEPVRYGPRRRAPSKLDLYKAVIDDRRYVRGVRPGAEPEPERRFETPQTMETVVRGLEGAFAFFGGVPAELLFDQMRAVVVGDRRAEGGRLLENREFLRVQRALGLPHPGRAGRVGRRRRGRSSGRSATSAAASSTVGSSSPTTI